MVKSQILGDELPTEITVKPLAPASLLSAPSAPGATQADLQGLLRHLSSQALSLPPALRSVAQDFHGRRTEAKGASFLNLIFWDPRAVAWFPTGCVSVAVVNMLLCASHFL